jgi:hypothetical protein
LARISLEDAALARLLRYLEAQGQAVEVRARPDRENHAGHAVDAELVVNGRAVGVEITELWSGARAQHELPRLQQAVERGVKARVRSWPAGDVAIGADFRELPPAKKLRTAETILAQEIAACIDSLDSVSEGRRETSIDSTVAFVRRLSVIQWPSQQSGFGWLTSSDEVGGWIAPLADAFVDHLLATKTEQTGAYREAWLLIVDREGLVDASNLAEALARRQPDVPANWSRVWLLPATDGTSVALVRGEGAI